MNYDDHQANAKIVVEALFPLWHEEAQTALAWLIADLLLSLDAISSNMPE